jgi:5-formyltetrahydrofolate cyclo-ligase
LEFSECNIYLFTKEFIRKSQKEKIKNLSKKKEKDLMIVNYLKKFINSKKNILIYNPLPDEPDISILLELFSDVNFLLPKITSTERRELSFIESKFFNNEEFQPNKFIPIELIDVFILPALGFSKNGFRLGRGGGYFDRSLKNIEKNKIIGVVYHEIYPLDFPVESHDLQVGTVVTERECFFMLDVFCSPDII